jgi:hypothetical protein
MTPAETARYTCELLESLRKIAARQGQGVLAHLLELARFEAQSLAASNAPGATAPQGPMAPKTKTPDSRDAGHSGPPVRVPAEP